MPEGKTKEELEDAEFQASLDTLDYETKMNMSFVKVNPDKFEQMRYHVKVEPQFIDRRTKITQRLALYDRLLANPLADQRASLRNLLLGSVVPGEEDVYMLDEDVVENMMQQNQKPQESTEEALAPDNQ